MLKNLNLKTSESFKWIEIKDDKKLPENAIIGGRESNGNPIYIGTAKHNSESIIGSVIKYNDKKYAACYVPYAGRSHEKKVFNILCGDEKCSVMWIEGERGSIPKDAVSGGCKDGPNAIYVGRARYCGNLVIGKVFPQHKCMYIGYNGVEIPINMYEVLTMSCN